MATELSNQSLNNLLNTSRLELTLSKGLHEVVKALECDPKPALCILANDCQESSYKQLITALCK